MGSVKDTDIDRPKDIFTDYRDAGDFIRHICILANFVILSVSGFEP
jgi:hypothetical protein